MYCTIIDLVTSLCYYLSYKLNIKDKDAFNKMSRIHIKETPVIDGHGSIMLNPSLDRQQRDLVSQTSMPDHDMAEHDGVTELRFRNTNEARLHNVEQNIAEVLHSAGIKVVPHEYQPETRHLHPGLLSGLGVTTRHRQR